MKWKVGKRKRQKRRGAHIRRIKERSGRQIGKSIKGKDREEEEFI